MFELTHMWAQTGPAVPGMTACAIVGPVLPLGNTARPRLTRTGKLDVFSCWDCAHLSDCEDEECDKCAEFASLRAAAAAEVVTVRLFYRRTPFARVADDEDIQPEEAPAAPAAPAGPANPERIELDGRTAWRFHLVEGVHPNKAAKPVRRALHAARPELRRTFTLAAGGDGTRSIDIVADDGEPSEAVWEAVREIAREGFGPLLAECVPAGGRHVEVFPF